VPCARCSGLSGGSPGPTWPVEADGRIDERVHGERGCGCRCGAARDERCAVAVGAVPQGRDEAARGRRERHAQHAPVQRAEQVHRAVAVLEQRPAAAAPRLVPGGKRRLAALRHGTALASLSTRFQAATEPAPGFPPLQSQAQWSSSGLDRRAFRTGEPSRQASLAFGLAGIECRAGRAHLTPAGCGHTRRTPPPACRASATGARGAHAKHHSPPEAVRARPAAAGSGSYRGLPAAQLQAHRRRQEPGHGPRSCLRGAAKDLCIILKLSMPCPYRVLDRQVPLHTANMRLDVC